MSRTSIARIVVVMFLVVVVGALQMSCGSSHPSKPQPPADSKVFTSTVDAGHSHTITIQKSELETPPTGGISRQTSSSSGHTHTFTMSEAELTNAKTGPVVVTTGVTGGHSHQFTIQKWY